MRNESSEFPNSVDENCIKYVLRRWLLAVAPQPEFALKMVKLKLSS